MWRNEKKQTTRTLNNERLKKQFLEVSCTSIDRRRTHFGYDHAVSSRPRDNSSSSFTNCCVQRRKEGENLFDPSGFFIFFYYYYYFAPSFSFLGYVYRLNPVLPPPPYPQANERYIHLPLEKYSPLLSLKIKRKSLEMEKSNNHEILV